MKTKHDKLRDRCFNEGVKYPEIKANHIDNELFERNLCKRKDNKISFNFVGFMISDNKLIVVFPKTYNIADDEKILKKQIQLLAKVLLKYRNEGNLTEEEKELLGSPEKDNYANRIAAAIWLINDFSEYGYIRREQKQRKINAGNNIDWARTVKEKQPYFSNNTPYYFDMVVRHSSIDYMNMLYRLHIYSVQDSFRKYGWIMDIDGYSVNHGHNEMPCDIHLANYILENEMRETFVHREIDLINTIREYILGSNESESKSKIDIFASPYFHNIWEKMCGKIFQNEYNTLKEYVPKPVWKIRDVNADVYRKQIPDILYRDQSLDKLFILDAKYYDTNYTLPGWHDLVKQFYYFYSITQNKEIKESENILIMPGVVNQDKLKYYGYVEIEGHKQLGKVDACLLDIQAVMGFYINKIQVKNIREKLKECISKN